MLVKIIIGLLIVLFIGIFIYLAVSTPSGKTLPAKSKSTIATSTIATTTANQVKTATTTATTTREVKAAPAKKVSFWDTFLSALGFTKTNRGSSGTARPAAQPAASSLPYGFTAADLSPYFKQIVISKVTLPHPVKNKPASVLTEINLASKIGVKEKVNLTGWKLQGNNGFAFIPAGSEILSPDVYKNTGGIVVQAGETVRLFSNKAPFSANFKMNKCIGYLNVNRFVPELPRQCPLIYQTRSQLSTYGAACQDYVLSLKVCDGPLTKLPTFNDLNCFNTLLKNAEYPGCFVAHHNDKDFFSKEWRVWLGSVAKGDVSFLDARHDRLLLFDNNGLLVYEYFY